MPMILRMKTIGHYSLRRFNMNAAITLILYSIISIIIAGFLDLFGKEYTWYYLMSNWNT